MPRLPRVALESKVAFLRAPSSYPERAHLVEAVETHMAWVFLAGDYVYKLKKPVCHERMDFRTLDARRHFCAEEVRLNRRLAPDVYLGAVPLALDAHARLRIGRGAETVDWLVKMRRLPACRMLDHLIAERRARTADFARIAAMLARFYPACAQVATSPQSYCIRMEAQIDANRTEQGACASELPHGIVGTLCLAQAGAMRALEPLLAARVGGGRIVEGHGDLRPEHICLGARLAVIDCLEFAPELRALDPADELAYLALECERAGAAQAATVLQHAYGSHSGDHPDARLVHFYQSYRASLRATLALRHLREAQFRCSPQWLGRARQYLQLAQEHIGRCR
ncbi:hypothetical protein [Massilia glaciei]|uniref:Aminoglycoside phosphotransferase domain-containing protein n=1 Tax=Massilia glaciei TaxID=1524097 RepID=A0A2U2HHI1_9BURK|nr:hypothetical protein [Massilia glaciei]PWF45381.1 hypothetical protein C7C56_017960 [Massilia glaciei]